MNFSPEIKVLSFYSPVGEDFQSMKHIVTMQNCILSMVSSKLFLSSSACCK